MKVSSYISAAFPPARSAPAINRAGIFLLLSFLSGLIIGVLTLVGQGSLPDGVLQLANSGAVWVIIAFIIGRFAAAWQSATMGGFMALIGEIAGYYLAAHYLIDADATSVIIIFWLLVAVVAGPLLGWAGFVSHNGSGVVQMLGTAALGAAFIGEGLYLMTILPGLQTGFLWLCIALVITLLLTWRSSERIKIFLITIALGLIFFGGEQTLVLLDQLRATVFAG